MNAISSDAIIQVSSIFLFTQRYTKLGYFAAKYTLTFNKPP